MLITHHLYNLPRAAGVLQGWGEPNSIRFCKKFLKAYCIIYVQWLSNHTCVYLEGITQDLAKRLPRLFFFL